MDARLIARLDPGAERVEAVLQVPDHRVLRSPGRIGIEIENVVVGDAVIDRASRQHIPYGLHQTAGDDPRVRQRKAEQFIRDRLVDGIAEGGGEEVVTIHRRSVGWVSRPRPP